MTVAARWRSARSPPGSFLELGQHDRNLAKLIAWLWWARRRKPFHRAHTGKVYQKLNLEAPGHLRVSHAAGSTRNSLVMNTRYRRRRAATAYHEAGHAVIAQVLGCQVMLVSIVRRGTSRGRARSDSPWDSEQNAWILLAGPTAQWMSGYCTRRTVWR